MRVPVYEFRCPICHGAFLAQKDLSRPVTCADCGWRGSYQDSASVCVDVWEFGAQMALPFTPAAPAPAEAAGRAAECAPQ